MIRAYIPKYKLIENDGGRNYYVYIVEVSYAGKLHQVEKRYSAFHRLYKELEKSYMTGDFPPKRLRNTTHKVLELRRTGLEAWLQLILKIQPVIPPSVISFLEINNYQPPVSEIESLESELREEPPNLTGLSYPKDPFLSSEFQSEYLLLQNFCSSDTSPLANSVIRGVLIALYDPSFRVDVP